MNKQEIVVFVKKQFDLYNLHDWKLSFISSSKQIGKCSYRTKTISLNKSLILKEESLVHNTIYHEIAHALCPGQKHSDIWKNKNIQLGGNGQIHSLTKLPKQQKKNYKCSCGSIDFCSSKQLDLLCPLCNTLYF